MSVRSAPWFAYAGAAACSAAALGSVPVVLIAFDLDQSWSRPLAFGICAAGGAGFGFAWPAAAWRWGVWASCVPWLFFAWVFVAVALRGRFDPAPLLDAAGALAAGCLGAFAGSRAGAGRGAGA